MDDLRLDVEGRKIRQHVVQARVQPTRPCGSRTTAPKLRRSSLKWPITQSPTVSTAERNGLENVEKNSAIAVTSISSIMISTIAFSIAGSVGGAGQTP